MISCVLRGVFLSKSAGADVLTTPTLQTKDRQLFIIAAKIPVENVVYPQ